MYVYAHVCMPASDALPPGAAIAKGYTAACVVLPSPV